MARRVNVKFLTIITVAVAVLVGFVLAAPMLMKPKNAGVALGHAREAVKKGDMRTAKELYVRALSIEPNNPQICLELGDVFTITSRSDRNDWNRDEQQWSRALEINPKFTPAAERLLDRWVEYTRLRPRDPEGWTRLEQVAKLMQAADPDAARGPAYAAIATVGGWMAGKPNSPEEVERALVALAAMAPKHPELSDVAYWAARGRLRLMQDAKTKGDDDQAMQQHDKALAVFEEAVKAAPDNPSLLYRYYGILISAAEIASGKPDPAQVDKARATLQLAYGKVQPQDADYRDILIAWSNQLLSGGKVEEAEEIARQLLDQKPHDTDARLHMAQLLRKFPREKRPDALARAMKVLADPVDDDPALHGFRARSRDYFEFIRLAELAQVRMDAWRESSDDKERATLASQVQEDYRAAVRNWRDDDPLAIKLQAYILLMDTKDPARSMAEAIKLMRSSLDKYKEQGRWDLDLMLRLALAYLQPDVNQPGQARRLLSDIVALSPKSAIVRKQLADVLLRQGEYNEAKVHIEALEKESAADSDVMRLRIRLMIAMGQGEKVKPMIKGLPEETFEQKLYKSQVYQANRMTADAIALLEPMSREELEKAGEAAFPATQQLAQVYAQDKRNGDAIALAKRVLAKVPDNQRWVVTLAVLQGKIDEKKAREVITLTTPDPVQAAIKINQMYSETGLLEKGLATLLEAEKERSDDRLSEAVFNQAMAMRKFDLAAQYAARLEKSNFDEAQGLSYKARLQLAQHDMQGALKSATELTRKRGDIDRNWVILAQVQQTMSQYEAAIISYTKALNSNSNNPEAIAGLVECNLYLNQLATAKRFIERGMTLPGYRARFDEMGKSVVELYEDPARITAIREQDLKENPELPSAHLLLSDNYVRCAQRINSRKEPAKVDELLSKAQKVLEIGLDKWADQQVFYNRYAELCLRRAALTDSKPKQDDFIDHARKVLERLDSQAAWKDRPEPQLMLAVFNERIGNIVETERAYLAALNKSNNALAIREQLGNFYLRTHNTDKGIAIFRGMLDQTHDPNLQTRLVQILSEADRPEEAERIVTQALAANPKDARALSLMAYLKINARQVEQARRYVNEALAADPTYATALYQRGSISLATGDLAAAEKDLAQARDIDPNRVDVHVALAEVYRRRNQIDDSCNELEFALQLAPTMRDVRLKLLNQYAAAPHWIPFTRLLDAAKANPQLSGDPVWWKLEAQMWFQQKDYEKAMASIYTALQMAPQDEEAMQTLLEVAAAKGDVDAVLALTKPDPDHAVTRSWWMLNARAAALKQKGQAKEAEALLDDAVRAVDTISSEAASEQVATTLVQVLGTDAAARKIQDRVKPYWALQLAKMYAGGPDWPKSVTVADGLRQRVNSMPEAAQVRILPLIGQIYAAAAPVVVDARSKSEETYTHYLTLVEKRPTEVMGQINALNNLAVLFIESDNPNLDKAMSYGKRAFDKMQGVNMFDASVADTYGWVLVRKGRLDEGIEVLRAITESPKPIPDAYYHLGEAFILRCNEPAAVKDPELSKRLRKQAHDWLDQANDTLKKNRDRGFYVDPTLGGRIAAALEKLKAMENAPAAANATGG
jgi:tetratricopeptide (TPR) repeat protein